MPSATQDKLLSPEEAAAQASEIGRRCALKYSGIPHNFEAGAWRRLYETLWEAYQADARKKARGA